MNWLAAWLLEEWVATRLNTVLGYRRYYTHHVPLAVEEPCTAPPSVYYESRDVAGDLEALLMDVFGH